MDVRLFFEPERLAEFDFSKAPELVARRREGAAPQALDPADWTQWQRTQQNFLDHVRAPEYYTEERVRGAAEVYGRFFERKGPLTGNVLDVGGGFGLYRQWWEPAGTGFFVVHDPGVERFTRGATELHRRHYPRAFRLPMTFVEGFGEDLPYRSDTFDVCLVAAALDHFAAPERVIAEVYRCLKPGGRIRLFQTCRAKGHERGALASLVRAAQRPGRQLRKLYARLVEPPKHMRHFHAQDVAKLLEASGFVDVEIGSEPVKTSVFPFEGTKANRPSHEA